MLKSILIKYRYYVGVILALIPLLFIYVGDSYDWEGDTALMLRQAENISNGKPFYESDFIFNSDYPILSPPYYPPITPLLLSGIYKAFGHDIHAYLFLESVLYSLIGLFAFVFFKRYLPKWASLILVVLMLYNQYVFRLKLEIMSDVPFTLLIILFFIFMGGNKSKNFWKYILSGIIAGLAIETRSIGLALPLAFLVSLVWDWLSDGFRLKRNISYWIGPSVFFLSIIISLLILRLIFRPPINGISLYSGIFSLLSWDVILQNIKLYTSLIINIIISPLAGWGFLAIIIKAGVFVVVIIGLMKINYRKFRLPFLFLLIYMGVIIIYPYNSAGTRFILPILPFILVLFARGFQFILSLINLKSVRIIIFSLFISAEIAITLKGHYYFNQYHQPSVLITTATLEAFKKVAELTGEGDVIESSFPRIISFYTGRKAYTSGKEASLKTMLDNKRQYHGKFLLHSKKYGFKSENRLIRECSGLQLIWKNEGYQLFRFKDE